MAKYTVTLRADVMAEVDVEADSELEARKLAYEGVSDSDYEVDFSIESVDAVDDDA